jgi:arylsulfatase A-like enzyme
VAGLDRRNLLIVIVDHLAFWAIDQQPWTKIWTDFCEREQRTAVGHMPNCDRLRHESIWYRRAYSTASSTIIAVQSMLAGRWPNELGVRDLYDINSASIDEKCVPFWTEIVPQHYVDIVIGIQEIHRRSLDSILHRADDHLEEDTDHSIPCGTMVHDYLFPRMDAYPEPWISIFHTWPVPYAGRQDPMVAEYSYPDADRMIGEIISKLEAMGQWDRTVLVVMSDHGPRPPFHGDTYSLGANSVNEDVIRIPMLVRIPRLTGIMVPQPTSIVDIPLIFLGLEEWNDGKVNRDANDSPILAASRYGGIWNSKVATVTNRYKFIFNCFDAGYGGISTEVYDVISDPYENMSLSMEAPQRIRALASNYVGRKL